MTQTLPRGERRESARWLIGMGTLWLLLAAGLLVYRLANPAAVTIEWDTATEVDAAGFFLYRSESAAGEFALVNQELIPSQGGVHSGANYTYEDDEVRPGQTYYYLLEEVEFDSSRNRYEEDIFSYTVPHPWLVYLLSAIGMVGGLVLLMTGLKEG